MDSRQLLIHLAIWPNVAWIMIVLLPMLYGLIERRWDAEFMPVATPRTTPTSIPQDHSGTHRIATPTSASVTETSGK